MLALVLEGRIEGKNWKGYRVQILFWNEKNLPIREKNGEMLLTSWKITEHTHTLIINYFYYRRDETFKKLIYANDCWQIL